MYSAKYFVQKMHPKLQLFHNVNLILPEINFIETKKTGHIRNQSIVLVTSYVQWIGGHPPRTFAGLLLTIF